MKKVSHKKVEVVEYICDICKTRKAKDKCLICGKDICKEDANPFSNNMCNCHMDKIKEVAPGYDDDFDNIDPETFTSEMEHVTIDNWIILKVYEDDFSQIEIYKTKAEAEKEMDNNPEFYISIYGDYSVIFHNGQELTTSIRFAINEK